MLFYAPHHIFSSSTVDYFTKCVVSNSPCILIAFLVPKCEGDILLKRKKRKKKKPFFTMFRFNLFSYLVVVTCRLCTVKLHVGLKQLP